jgi:hydroxymethylglutaryl-CoA lyase
MSEEERLTQDQEEEVDGNVATEDLTWALVRSGAATGIDLDRVRAASDHLAAVLGRPLRSRVREALRS